MPVYAELHPVDLIAEIRARLVGTLTFLECGPFLVMRNRMNASVRSPAHLAHPHRNGFVPVEESCRTETNRRATDFSEPSY